MCLLDAVAEWSSERIRCVTSSHRHADNPLRDTDRLSAVCGIEYAAQAMAAHGALLAGQQGRPRQGFLVSVRNVELKANRLDDVAGELDIIAERLSGDGNNVLYSFTVSGDGRLLLSGRAAVILDAEAGK
jgi:predicted hotdog family 3-hydroxylacyl-ACP dehydratase